MDKQGDKTGDGPEGITVAENNGNWTNISIEAFAKFDQISGLRYEHGWPLVSGSLRSHCCTPFEL